MENSVNHRYWLIGHNKNVAVGKVYILIIDFIKDHMKGTINGHKCVRRIKSIFRLFSMRKTGIISISEWKFWLNANAGCWLMVASTAQEISRMTNARLQRTKRIAWKNQVKNYKIHKKWITLNNFGRPKLTIGTK